MIPTTIPETAMTAFLDSLDQGNRRVMERYPGESIRRQPVHTVYGGAHLFKADVVHKLGSIAVRTLQEYAPDAAALADALAMDRALAERIYPRLVDKLQREPIEDFRIDFEDGFGVRPPSEEDEWAVGAAREVAAGMRAGSLPPGIGIRIKPLGEETKRRSLRTFDLFLSALLDASGGTLPPHFVITLPKITTVGQVAAIRSACDAFEYWREVKHGLLRIELMIETTQSIFTPDGTIALPQLLTEGGGRVVAAHFGPYDYTAACNVTSTHQHLEHSACNFARHVMQVSLAGTGVNMSDGPTSILPIGPHRGSAQQPLTAEQQEENRRAVWHAWRIHAQHIRHALVSGCYQGWDLHPAQFPPRYATVYAFFLEGLAAASDRLRNFVEKAAQATVVGGVFDDAASGQGLVNYFLRAVGCGAIDPQEAVDKSGLTLEELRSRSFAAIVANRRKAAGSG